MAVHSHSKDYPTGLVANMKKSGWEEAYKGYSFIFQSGAGQGFGTALQNHGSCMRHFSPVGVAQSNGQEVRWISPNFKSLWLIDYSQLEGWDPDEGAIDQGWNVDEPAARRSFIDNILGKCIVMKRSAAWTTIKYHFTDQDN